MTIFLLKKSILKPSFTKSERKVRLEQASFFWTIFLENDSLDEAKKMVSRK